MEHFDHDDVSRAFGNTLSLEKRQHLESCRACASMIARERLCANIGWSWKSPSLLTEALTHSSYGNEHKTKHNERLEFLGDSVLDLLTADWLMAMHPNEREGFMSQRRAELVRASALAERAKEIGLDKALIVNGKDSYLRNVEGVLADAMEALVGALFVDADEDLTAVRQALLRMGVFRL